MKFCNKCKLSVVGKRNLCPLCQGELKDLNDDNREIFPEIPTMFHKYSLFFRILILSSVTVAIVSVMFNVMFPTEGWWSLFVVAGIGCFWIGTAIAISKRTNIPKNILYQVVLLSALAVLWDNWTHWHAWSVNYVIPIVCIGAMISMAIIAKVTNLHARDYMIYLIIDGLFGIVPIVFYFTGLLTMQYPSLICVAASIISLVSLLLFEGENMRSELKRRLHF